MSPLTLRRWHSYVGLFAAPTVLFFTLTGAVQLFNWHEAHGSYHPAVLLKRLSSLHKDQVLKRHQDQIKEEGTNAPAPGEPAAVDDEDESVPPATFALKVFFFMVAIGVALSTCFGVWMGVAHTSRRGTAITLLVTGTLLPIVLLAL